MAADGADDFPQADSKQDDTARALGRAALAYQQHGKQGV